MRDEQRNERMGADAGMGDISAGPHATYVLVRAAANLAPGLRFGDEVLIDATDPEMQDLLRAQFLIPLPAYRQPPTGDVT